MTSTRSATEHAATMVKQLRAINAELLDALVALSSWIDDGEYAAFSPAAMLVDGGPTLRQLDRFRQLNRQVHEAIRAGMRGSA